MNQLLARFRTAWDNFSPRERALTSTAGGIALVALFWLAAINPFFAATENAHMRVSAAEQQVQAMRRLRQEFDEVNGRLQVVENRIRNNRSRQNVLTLLESLATRSQVKIDSMEERQAGDSELYQETRVEVQLKNVSLTQTIQYLHNIETAERLFSVKSMRIKGRPDGSDLLDVTFTVSSFELI